MAWSPPEPTLPWISRNLDVEVQEFVGPPTFHVMGAKYATMTHGGEKTEAAPFPGPPIWTEPQAWSLFKEQIRKHIDGATQVAWRRMPAATQLEDGSWAVSARIAVYGNGEARDV